MLCCYQPDPPPLRVDNPDRVGLSILLYRRYWLHIHWTGMQSEPSIDRAYVTDGVHEVPVNRERLHVLSRAAFDTWYAMHWKQFVSKEVIR